MMKVVIDQNSGFCFGVIYAINTAEKYLAQNHQLYCLGDIVHNNEEVKRLSDLGLIVITYEQFKQLHHAKVLIRAHGEPPEIYQIAHKNNIELIDATCRVVLHLQKTIKKNYEDPLFQNGQILIFGKQGHAEVVGLIGQTEQNGIVLSSLSDVDKIDFTRPSKLYAQTTQSLEEYSKLIEEIKKRYQKRKKESLFEHYDTICRSVANRSKQIQNFASQYDKIIFVSGEKSSNGLYLYDLCKKVNPNSYFVSHLEQLQEISFSKKESIGICGATSTPMWLMQQVAAHLS
ncbi:MAG: 4-hydroxy-3-methylbut-2-enyl diphosphate reductase [Bacteroidales bacterium]